jgi:integrase
VRWRDGDRQCKRRFDTRGQADVFDAERRLGPAPIVRALVTVDQLLDLWLSTITGLRPKTQDTYRLDARQVSLAFGSRLAAAVLPSEVQAWSSRDGLSASVRRRSLMKMRAAYKLGIADGKVSSDPTEGASLPKLTNEDMRFLSWSELRDLADAAGESAALVWVLGTCGLRLGEALALEGTDVDRARHRLRVRKSYTVSSRGAQLGPTKGNQARDVPASQDVLDLLPRTFGPLFTGAKGGRLSPGFWRTSVFHPAAERAGLGDLHPHELRHTAASLAIASGADVKVVQRMLGHKSATMTLDRYGHLWDGALDAVVERMNQARRREIG